MKNIFAIICVCALLISCVEKSVVQEDAKDRFAVYLLNDSSLKATDAAKAEINSLPLSSTPLFTSENLQFYKWSDHSFRVDSITAKKLGSLAKERPTVFGIPFVVTVDKERIYLGAFWFLYSSLGPPCPAIDITFTISKVQLDYNIGREFPMPNSNDKRNDERIYSALKSAGVLLD